MLGYEDIKKAAVLRYGKNAYPPSLVAKGKGETAERIIRIAEKNGVPVYEDRELVEILLSLELNDYVPEQLYGVVAEILAFIYNLNLKYTEAEKI